MYKSAPRVAKIAFVCNSICTCIAVGKLCAIAKKATPCWKKTQKLVALVVCCVGQNGNRAVDVAKPATRAWKMCATPVGLWRANAFCFGKTWHTWCKIGNFERKRAQCLQRVALASIRVVELQKKATPWWQNRVLGNKKSIPLWQNVAVAIQFNKKPFQKKLPHNMHYVVFCTKITIPPTTQNNN